METVLEVEADSDVDAAAGIEAVLEWSSERLESELCRGSANMTAFEARWLLMLAEFDRRRVWDSWGCTSCAAWLAWQTSLDLRTAHEKIRVAHALVRLPALAAEMSTGALSYAKVRALTRIMNEHNIDDLLPVALAATSNQVEKIVSGYRRYEADADDAEARAHRDRSVNVRNEGATAVITIRVPVETGATMIACMEQFMDDTDAADPLSARRADAAFAMAAHAAATFGEPGVIDDAHLVTVHLTPDVFDDEQEESSGQGCGFCCVAPGDGLGTDPVSVPRKSARRVLCDAVMQGYRHHDDGRESVGQGRRTVSRRLKRALRLRDHGCRFPGCGHSAWVDAHHIIHWLDHGRTIESNLVCLCRRHHRLIHEGGWTITGDPRSEMWFHRPDGTVIPAQPLRVAGSADAVEATGRTAQDGRCGWWGDELDLHYTLQVITGNEHARAARAARHNN